MSTFIRVGAPHGEFKEFSDNNLSKNVNKVPLMNMIRGLGISVDKASEYMNDFLTKTCGYKSDDLKKAAIKKYTSKTMTYTELCTADIESSAVGRICFIGHCVHSIKPQDRVFSDQANIAARDALRDEELADAAGESYTPSFQNGQLLVHHPLVVQFHRMMKKIKENRDLFEFDALYCMYLEMYRRTKTLDDNPFVYMDPQIDGYIEVRKTLDIDFYPKVATEYERKLFLERIALAGVYKATIKDVESKIKPKKPGGGLHWVDIYRMSMFLNVGNSIIEHLTLDWPSRERTDGRSAKIYAMMLGIVYMRDGDKTPIPSTNSGYLHDKVSVGDDRERAELTEDVKRLVKDCTKSKFDEYLEITDSEFETFKDAMMNGEPIMRGTKRPNDASGSSILKPLVPPPQPPAPPPPTAPATDRVVPPEFKRVPPETIANLERLFVYCKAEGKQTYEKSIDILRNIKIIGDRAYDCLKNKDTSPDIVQIAIDSTEQIAARWQGYMKHAISLGVEDKDRFGYTKKEFLKLLAEEEDIPTFAEAIHKTLIFIQVKRAGSI